jgi:hypothetical protein
MDFGQRYVVPGSLRERETRPNCDYAGIDLDDYRVEPVAAALGTTVRRSLGTYVVAESLWSRHRPGERGFSGTDPLPNTTGAAALWRIGI